ncbi:MAG: aldo/keto reductase [Akkermansiaceae bacterium]|nr:aldo/keto reductase [Akkermansiaceae bacterium]
MTKTIQGREVPSLGFGTYELEGEVCREAVECAIQTGYRHIDTARMYENEADVGRGIASSGIQREDLFVTSKVWWEHLEPEQIERETEESLKQLDFDYLDLMLIHWPNPEVSLEASIEALHQLRESGKIRHYGVSNFTPSLFKEACEYGEIFCNQVEYHPQLGQLAVLEAARQNGSAVTAYSPLGQGEEIGHEVLEEIGEKHGKSSAQVSLRWLIEQDVVLAIPRSSKREHIESNFDIFDFELDSHDKLRIGGLPKDQRQIDPDFAPDWENLHTL